MVTKICPLCGKKFETNRSNKKYCSYDCYREANLQRVRLEQRAAIERRRKQNEEELKMYSPEAWKFLNEIAKRQQEIIINKKNYCEACKRTDKDVSLVLHHVRYDPLEIVTLCTRCHAILHNGILRHKKCKIINIS